MVGYAPIFIPAVGFVSAAGAGVHRRTIANRSGATFSVVSGCLRSLTQGQLVRWKMNKMTHKLTHPQYNGAISGSM
jgi:hypothetical protein